MKLKRFFFFMVLVNKLVLLTAQENAYTGVKYELFIEELRQPPKYEERWGFGGAYACNGQLTSVLCCLLRIEDGRLKIKGQIRESYLKVGITEPSMQNLGTLLANAYQTHASDSLSLVTTAIGLLEKRYNFKITNITDTIEVWCLKIADKSKLVRYNEVIDTDNRGSGIDIQTNEWESTGMILHYLCVAVAEQSKVIVYDETDDIGNFTFTRPPIPVKYMKDFNAINRLLETHYGLHFVKRKQLEALKLIEFK
jgi:hypothetical protein